MKLQQIAVAMFCALSVASNASTQFAQFRVEQGILQGVAESGVNRFLGIPFAAPPVDRNRWRAPQPASHWSGVRAALHFGASCMQELNPGGGRPPWTAEYLIAGPRSEDCLFLNVWAPRQSKTKLPVLFWIHGGAFREGSGDVPIYDGARLAAHGVIVVTINYRLGIYGFLAHPELSAEGGGSSGNYGLLDQIAALRWVKRNIAAVGGDPKRVTIAGQSAGAASVHDLILSPLAKGLFHQAIAQSGSGMGIGFGQKQAAEAGGLRFAEAAGARSLTALRALAPDQVGAAVRTATAAPDSTLRFGPVADGSVLPVDAAAMLASGRYNDTPILTGLNQDEGSSDPGYRPRSADAYASGVRQRYGGFADRLLALYPPAEHVNAGPALGRDRGIASLLLWARQRRQTSHHPIYGYLFSHVEPGPDSAKFGAFHSSEIPYVFGTLDKAPERGFTALDQQVSNRLQAYWLSFVKTGDPNGAHLHNWPQLDESLQLLELGDTDAARVALPADRLALFSELAGSGGRLGLF